MFTSLTLSRDHCQTLPATDTTDVSFKVILMSPEFDSITLLFLCIRKFFSVFYVRNTTELGGLRRRVSTFSEAGERNNSTVTMLKISTTCSVPYGISSVGSHSISCAMTFLPSFLHVTLFGNGKFCREQSAFILIQSLWFILRVVNVQGTDLSCVFNMYGGVQIHLKAFVTLALDRSGSLVLCPCVNSPQGTHWIGNWMSYSTGLDVLEMTTDMLKILILKQVPNTRTIQFI